MSFFLTELALHTASLLGQLVFCTYALFGAPKKSLRKWPSGYGVGLQIRRPKIQDP